VKPKILLVDDEVQLLAQMRWILDADYDIETATNEEDALNSFQRISSLGGGGRSFLKSGKPPGFGGFAVD
jgi:hypothetical protein